MAQTGRRVIPKLRTTGIGQDQSRWSEGGT